MSPRKVSATEGKILREVRDTVAIVRLSRPKVLNALTPSMVDALRATVDELDRLASVKAMVITGEGRAFCSGADIGWESQAEETEYVEFIESIQDLTRMLRGSDLFNVAALNGTAVGGGFELALACDGRIAHSEALVGFPEVSLGLTVTGGVTYMLPRLVGTSAALELLISGRSLSAEEAASLGLVDRLSADPVADAVQLASLADAAPRDLVGLIKTALYSAEAASLDEALAIEKETIIRAFRRPGTEELLGAFADGLNRRQVGG